MKILIDEYFDEIEIKKSYYGYYYSVSEGCMVVADALNCQKHVMGRETIRRELKLIPARAVIVEHVRKVYACRQCEKDECGVPIIKAAVSKFIKKDNFLSFIGERKLFLGFWVFGFLGFWVFVLFCLTVTYFRKIFL